MKGRDRSLAIAMAIALTLYCVGIFAASSMSRPPGLETVEQHVSDKVVHATAFLGMALLAIGNARSWRAAWSLGAQLTAGVVFTVLFGVSDEIHQAFTPGRSPDVLDVAADTVGALTAAALVFLASKFVRTTGVARCR